MNCLYLLKSFPIREYSISKCLQKVISDEKSSDLININCVVFSQRNYVDIERLQKQESIFHEVYNYIAFARKQKKISLYDISINLKKYEQKYGIPVNFALHADRYIVDNCEAIRRQKLYFLIEFALYIFSERKFDYIIGELSSASDIIFYYLAKYLNIPYITLVHGRVKNRIEFSNLEGQRIDLKTIYDNKKKNGFTLEEEKIVNEYLDGFSKGYSEIVIPDYVKFGDTTQWKQLFRKTYHDNSIQRFINYAYSYYYDQKWSADMNPSIRLKIKQRINKLIYPLKMTRLKQYFQNSDIQDDYLLFPLHYQPEASTMTYAQDYLNQLAFIENIAKHLPGGYYLYVKEHPGMIAYREHEFYKSLYKLPNVKIIAPNEPIKTLILRSQGVITLTSTTGYEAIVYDKPVFVFGNVFYQEYDYIHKCNSFSKLRMLFSDVLTNWDLNYNTRQENKKYFVYACLASLKSGNMNSHVYDRNVLTEDNCLMIANSINNFMKIFKQ